MIIWNFTTFLLKRLGNGLFSFASIVGFNLFCFLFDIFILLRFLRFFWSNMTLLYIFNTYWLQWSIWYLFECSAYFESFIENLYLIDPVSYGKKWGHLKNAKLSILLPIVTQRVELLILIWINLKDDLKYQTYLVD